MPLFWCSICCFPSTETLFGIELKLYQCVMQCLFKTVIIMLFHLYEIWSWRTIVVELASKFFVISSSGSLFSVTIHPFVTFVF